MTQCICGTYKHKISPQQPYKIYLYLNSSQQPDYLTSFIFIFSDNIFCGTYKYISILNIYLNSSQQPDYLTSFMPPPELRRTTSSTQPDQRNRWHFFASNFSSSHFFSEVASTTQPPSAMHLLSCDRSRWRSRWRSPWGRGWWPGSPARCTLGAPTPATSSTASRQVGEFFSEKCFYTTGGIFYFLFSIFLFFYFLTRLVVLGVQV